MKERTRLKLDLDALLPGDEFPIGNETVTIRPLSLVQYKLIIGKVKALFAILKTHGVTGENYKDTDNLILIAEIVVEQFPDLLEEISNIASEDLQELPIEIIVALIDKCLEVNMKAKDSLMGNFKSLIGKINVSGLLEKTETTETKNQPEVNKE